MFKKTNQIIYQSKIIDKLINEYSVSVNEEEFGLVATNVDGILHVIGLNNCYFNELLIIDNHFRGLAFSLCNDYIGVIVLDNDFNKITENMKVTRTKKLFSIPVGDQLLGRVIDSLGETLDNGPELNFDNCSQIEKNAPQVLDRDSVNEPMSTGKLIVDSMFPIGKGQRELIIGDRQTGKTTLALDTIINQKGKNCYCIYVAIGQKNSSIVQIIKKLRNNDALKYSTVVAAGASNLPSQKFLAPFVGITIAEEWMRQGKNVLIVYDNLSQHAISYRTLSLLLQIPAGREAYPGDIFYLHSRLLERSGKLSKELGGGSITALPIIETQAGDISSYVPTNVISITDGQIFLKTNLFNSNFRPAVDVGLSVSRVGGAAQTNIIKKLSDSLKFELSQYYEIMSFAQFSSDLDESTKKILNQGEKIITLLKQEAHELFDDHHQIYLLYLIKNDKLNNISNEELINFRKFAFEHLNFINFQEQKLINYTPEIIDQLSKLHNQIFSDYKLITIND